MFIKFDNNKIKITISNQVVLILIGVIIILCILFANGLSSTMIGFWGSVLGGMIGGIFTVVGVSQTLRYESDKTRKNELTLILTQLLDMSKQVKDHINELMELNKHFRQINWTGQVHGSIIGIPLEEFKEKTDIPALRIIVSSRCCTSL